MKREKKLTKRERKALQPARPAAAATDDSHIHCIACGRHIDPAEFDTPATAVILTCQHKSSFPACKGCTTQGTLLLEAHDRSGQPVKTASAWH